MCYTRFVRYLIHSYLLWKYEGRTMCKKEIREQLFDPQVRAEILKLRSDKNSKFRVKHYCDVDNYVHTAEVQHLALTLIDEICCERAYESAVNQFLNQYLRVIKF